MLEYVSEKDERGYRYVLCRVCSRRFHTPHGLDRVYHQCTLRIEPAVLRDSEIAELFPDSTDRTLIGNRIAAMTEALGIPPCGGCDKRRKWMNRAHAWLRSLKGAETWQS